MDANNLVNTATYLKDEFGIIWIPFFPFLGNRFSIPFVNAAGLYFLYDQLLNCFWRIELDTKLSDGVHFHLEALSFSIQCRTLGLIEKLITGPVWKIMVGETHLLRMSRHCQKHLEFLESSSEDSSEFLKGQFVWKLLFINRDECLKKVFEHCDQQTELMTKDCFKILFGGLKMVPLQMS